MLKTEENTFKHLFIMDKTKYLTSHFKRSEFACKCCGTEGIGLEIVYVLELLRCIIDAPLIINSGYRCYNHHKEIYRKLSLKAGRKIKAPEKSQHLNGNAVDFTFKDQEDLDDAAIILQNWSGGLKYYEDDGFIHIDIGPKRRW